MTSGPSGEIITKLRIQQEVGIELGGVDRLEIPIPGKSGLGTDILAVHAQLPMFQEAECHTGAGTPLGCVGKVAGIGLQQRESAE